MDTKIVFKANLLKENLAKFKANENLPAEISLPFLAYSDKWNSNTQSSQFRITFNIQDLVEPVKTRLVYNHTGNDNKPAKNQLIKNTYLHNKKVETREDKDGKYEVITGELYSNNPKFIQELKDDKFTGFSIEVAPLNNDSVFFNESDQVFFKQAIMPFMAALTDEAPAVPSAGVIGNLNFAKGDFGYENIPKKVSFTKFNNMDEKQLQELIQNSVKAEFKALKQEQEEAKQIKFSFDKDAEPKAIFDALAGKFSNLENYSLVKKEEEKDPEAEDQKDAGKFAEYQGKLAKNGKEATKKVTKFSEEEKPTTNLNQFFNI